jgi:hypothetical protein
LTMANCGPFMMFTTHGYKYHTSSNSSLVQVEIRRFTLFQLNLGAQIRLLVRTGSDGATW